MKCFSLMILICLFGCVEYLDIDPETTWDPAASSVDYDGDPALEIGFYREQLYTVLEDGGGCPVVNGLQGGNWTMPALRTFGITPMAWVTCTLVTDWGEEVATTEVRSQFFRGVDDAFEIQSFPIPVFRSETSATGGVSDLYSEMAQLTCNVRGDDGGTASYSVRVEIVED